jgi:hypothetical protein
MQSAATEQEPGALYKPGRHAGPPTAPRLPILDSHPRTVCVTPPSDHCRGGFWAVESAAHHTRHTMLQCIFSSFLGFSAKKHRGWSLGLKNATHHEKFTTPCRPVTSIGQGPSLDTAIAPLQHYLLFLT